MGAGYSYGVYPGYYGNYGPYGGPYGYYPGYVYGPYGLIGKGRRHNKKHKNRKYEGESDYGPDNAYYGTDYRYINEDHNHTRTITKSIDDENTYDMEPFIPQYNMVSANEFVSMFSKTISSIKTDELKRICQVASRENKKALDEGNEDAIKISYSIMNITKGELSSRYGVRSVNLLGEDVMLPEDTIAERRRNTSGEISSSFNILEGMDHEHDPNMLKSSFENHVKKWKEQIRGKYLDFSRTGDSDTKKDLHLDGEYDEIGDGTHPEKRRKKKHMFISREFDYRNIIGNHDMIIFELMLAYYLQNMLGDNLIEQRIIKELRIGTMKAVMGQVPEWFSGLDYAALRHVVIAYSGIGVYTSKTRSEERSHLSKMNFKGDFEYDPMRHESIMSSYLGNINMHEEYYKLSKNLRKEWSALMMLQYKHEKQLIRSAQKAAFDPESSRMEDTSRRSKMTASLFTNSSDYELYMNSKEVLQKLLSEDVSLFWTKVVFISLGYSPKHFDNAIKISTRFQVLKNSLMEGWVVHQLAISSFIESVVLSGGISSIAMAKRNARTIYERSKDFGEILNNALYFEAGEPVSRRRIHNMTSILFDRNQRL